MGAHMSSLAAVPAGDREMLAPQRFATPSTAGFILYWYVGSLTAQPTTVFVLAGQRHS